MTNIYKQKQRITAMNLIKNQIQLNLTKSELNTILAEAMQDETAGASIKRILNPYIANSFPQFPEHTGVTLGSTSEDGTTTVTLKVPAKRTVVIEETTETVEECEDTVAKDDGFGSVA